MTQTNSKPLILIVDDDRTMRSLLNLAMSEEGYEIAEAQNGEQCLSEYVNCRPDLILLDAVMPDIDGFSCCQQIRNLPGGDTIPILMITVLDDQTSVEKAFDAGATDYVTKPIHWAVLSNRVRYLLASNQAKLEVSKIKDELIQLQFWENFLREIVQDLGTKNHEIETIEFALKTVRNHFSAARVVLYDWQTKTIFESCPSDLVSIKAFAQTDFSLMSQYQDRYEQGQAITINDLDQAEFSASLLEKFQKLATKSLAIFPMLSNQKVSGILAIHFDRNTPNLDKLTLNQFLDLGRLLLMSCPSTVTEIEKLKKI